MLAVLVPAGATGARAPVRLTLGYSVPPRYGLPVAVAPAAWPALVTVRWPDGRPCTGTYTWTIGGHANTFVQQKDSLGRPTCVFRFDGFPALDHPYRVDVAATRAGVHGAGRTQVTIHDTLVVGLGDSNASGEGNPDHAIAPVRWQDRRCHRSANGFEALTASRLEKASDKSSVTYIPLACSGAAIITGLLAPYAGIEPVGTTKVPAQIQAMKAQLGTRTPDAVLVSIGINDLGFGNVAFFCFDDGVDAKAAATVDCWTKRYPSATSPVTLKAWVRARAALLPGRYAQLAAAFQRAGIPASKIYVTEYPNGTRDAHGRDLQPARPVPRRNGIRLPAARRDHPRRGGAGRDRDGADGEPRARAGGRDVRLALRLRDRRRDGAARALRGAALVRQRGRLTDRAARRVRDAASERPRPAGDDHRRACRVALLEQVEQRDGADAERERDDAGQARQVALDDVRAAL